MTKFTNLYLLYANKKRGRKNEWIVNFHFTTGCTFVFIYFYFEKLNEYGYEFIEKSFGKSLQEIVAHPFHVAYTVELVYIFHATRTIFIVHCTRICEFAVRQSWLYFMIFIRFNQTSFHYHAKRKKDFEWKTKNRC